LEVAIKIVESKNKRVSRRIERETNWVTPLCSFGEQGGERRVVEEGRKEKEGRD
jgi:hypothetical protein